VERIIPNRWSIPSDVGQQELAGLLSGTFPVSVIRTPTGPGRYYRAPVSESRAIALEPLIRHSKAFDDQLLVERLTEEFGPYLLQYPGVHIRVQGQRLDPKALIGDQVSVDLPPFTATSGITTPITARVRIVEWKKASERRIFLCDGEGTTLTEVPMRSHLLDGYVTAYVESDQFSRTIAGIS
jgi:hypothetical protein